METLHAKRNIIRHVEMECHMTTWRLVSHQMKIIITVDTNVWSIPRRVPVVPGYYWYPPWSILKVDVNIIAHLGLVAMQQ